MKEHIDLIRDRFPSSEYEIIDGISEIGLLASNAIYPISMEINSNGFNSCIYRKDDEMFADIHYNWNNTDKYSNIKLNNKAIGKVKKAFKTKNINDMKMYR